MKVHIGNEEIDLDPEVMKFNEASLNEYLMKDAGFYSYFHAKMVDAQFIAARAEDEYDVAYSQKYRIFKEDGATEKLAEAMSKADPDVIIAKEKVRLTKRVKDQIWGFLKAMDKAHDNALNLGYNVRKEMQVLHHQQVKSLDDIMN